MTVKTEWDLTPLFADDDDPRMLVERKEAEKKVDAFVNKWKARDDWKQSPAALREALDEYEKLCRTFGAAEEGRGSTEGYYFWLKAHKYTSDPAVKARYEQVKDFGKKLEDKTRFFELAIARISPEVQKKMLAAPELEKYRHLLKRSFDTSPHLLGEEAERVMSLKYATSYDRWHSMFYAFLIKEERMVLDEDGKEKMASYSEIGNLMSSKKKDVRERAAAAHNSIIEKWLEVGEAYMNALLDNRKNDDLIRGFSRPDEGRHLSDDIEAPVIDALLKAVKGKFEIAQRFYKLKAKLLGVPKLGYNERNVPYGEAEMKFTFKESVEFIDKVFKKLDPEFARLAHEIISKGQVDVYPAAGKTSGGFCVYWLITHPTYILLNSTDRLEDMLVLAHELGHALNNEFVKKKQPSLYYGTSTATAEVASTFMEDFVLEELRKEGGDEFQLSLMMKRLDDDINSIFKQCAGYMFEQELHEMFRKEGHLSKEEIGKLYERHMYAYLGDSITKYPGSENWWSAWHHFRYYFYIYSYASGLLISKYLQKQVRKNPQFIEKVKDFLSSGLSDSPKNVFAHLGVDITKSDFWEAGLSEIETHLAEAEKLAHKLGKF